MSWEEARERRIDREDASMCDIVSSTGTEPRTSDQDWTAPY